MRIGDFWIDFWGIIGNIILIGCLLAAFICEPGDNNCRKR